MSKINIDENVINSLVFFCFGFDKKDTKDYVIKRVVQKAYFDATNQGAFNTRLSKKIPKNDKLKFKEKLISYFYKEIKGYTSKGSKNEYDKWHSEICNSLKTYSCYGISFTFGNSQKLVNMTMKYLYMLAAIDFWQDEGLKKFLTNVKNDEKWLHVPVDSYIIDAAFKKYDEAKGIVDEDNPEVKEHLVKKDNVPKKIKISESPRPSDYIYGWSSWNDIDLYDLFRINLDKDLNWELDAWIKAAKDRRPDIKEQKSE